MVPPFEDLPLFIQIVLVISSVLTLTLGGVVFWRMLRTVFKRPDDPDDQRPAG